MLVLRAAPVTEAPVPGASSRSGPAHRRSLMVGVLIALLAFMSVFSYAFPTGAAAATTLATQCNGVALRTYASTSATLKVRLAAGVRVTAVARISGGRWSTYCAGASKSGTSWYRITAIGGKSVKTLYGVSYLYGATSLFKVVIVPATMYTACSGTTARTSPSVTATIKARLAAGTKVVVYGAVNGGAWSITCPRTATGVTWYRVMSINGTSVKTLYGVSYLYVASGLLTSTSPALAPAPTATPKPTATPTPKPTATPSPSLTPPAAVTPSPSASASTAPSATPTPTPKPTPTPTPTITPIPIGTPPPSQANNCYPVSPTPTPVPTATPTPNPSASASASATPTPTPTPAPTATPWHCVTGVDVSNWQGTINWTQVASTGVKFAFVKATEGKCPSCTSAYTDPYYPSNRTNANANGIIVGAYDFAQPSTAASAAQAEADNFVNYAMPKSGDLTPVLDLETTNGLSVANLQTWVKAWLYRVYQRTGVRASIYVSPYFWSTYMGNSTWFAQNGFRTLWIAHWTSATSPSVPASNWANNSWTFWQWTSSGTVPGIKGSVDMDRFHYASLLPYRIP